MDNIDSLKKEIKKLEIIIADKDKTIRSLKRKSEVNEVNYEYIEQLNNVMKLNEDLTKEECVSKEFKTGHDSDFVHFSFFNCLHLQNHLPFQNDFKN